MKQRFLHIALAILVLAQPVAGVGAWALAPDSDLAAASAEAPMEEGMPGCHDAAEPDPAGTAVAGVDSHGEEVPDCCDSMECGNCGMDCGAVSSAINQSAVPQAIPGHGSYSDAVIYAAPTHFPTSLFKPPRTA